MVDLALPLEEVVSREIIRKLRLVRDDAPPPMGFCCSAVRKLLAASAASSPYVAVHNPNKPAVVSGLVINGTVAFSLSISRNHLAATL